MLEASKIEPGSDMPSITFEECGVHDTEIEAFVNPRLVNQPWRTLVEPSAALAERPKNLPCSYTWCRRFTPSPFADWHREFSTDPQFEVFELDTGHQCMLTIPRETTDIILRARCE